MTLREYIDRFREVYPDASITDIKRLINRGKDVFLDESRMYDSSWSVTTVSGQRYYALPAKAIAIETVDYDGTEIARMVGHPDTRDMT